MGTAQESCKRTTSQSFGELKPGKRFSYMGEWYLVEDQGGMKTGLRLIDQQHPCDSEASPTSAVTLSLNSMVSVLN